MAANDLTIRKKGIGFYLKRDWQLYLLMLLPMLFILVFKYLAYTGLSVSFLDYKVAKGYSGSEFVGLEIFEKSLPTGISAKLYSTPCC